MVRVARLWDERFERTAVSGAYQPRLTWSWSITTASRSRQRPQQFGPLGFAWAIVMKAAWNDSKVERL